MSWGAHSSFPKAIFHVDGDAFFAACEVAKNPKLRGLPVVTGLERGIVSAATYEAKRMGITRGVRLSDVKKICPEAIILASDYETYSLYSRRMYDIVRRYTPAVEEYGIDECFADLTGLRRLHHKSYAQLAKHIKEELEHELNLSFSVGLAPTKVLAKLGSKWDKPSGCTIIPMGDIRTYLAKSPVKNTWGIGPNTAAMLATFGVHTALQFIDKDEVWVRRYLSKPYLELWRELCGESVMPLVTDTKESYQSLSKTKTFTPPSCDRVRVWAELSKNIEKACIKARRYGLATSELFFFIKGQDFKYYGVEVRLSRPSNAPQEMLQAVAPHFERLYKRRVLYRATGVTLCKLVSADVVQMDLFGAALTTVALQKVYEHVDQLTQRYGKLTVFLASSMASGVDTAPKRLSIPMLGEVG
jgi:nucleotidyltransferase/DNA polymerase involved in DNA repair